MKRILLVLLGALLLLCACGTQPAAQPSLPDLPTVAPTTQPTSAAPQTTVLPSVFPSETQPAQKELRGVWLPYMELNPQGLTMPDAYRAYLAGVFAPLQRLQITDLFVQVRPFGDAIYPSAYFPAAACITGTRGGTLPFDYLQCIIETAKAYGMQVHAWLNPYRLSTTLQAPAVFAVDPVVGQWLAEPGQTDVRFLDNGVYLDPASARVQSLILSGVSELLDHYALAGIHIDDYFYPTTDNAFDDAAFAAYGAAGGTLSKSDWRRENVNTLVRAMYATVKAKNPQMLFSISPAGNIEKDENELFANVRRWGREPGYCDMLLPQIYFGFQNTTLPFSQCLAAWQSLCAGSGVRLVVGLAVYKIGETDDYAGAGVNEWIEDETVLQRQVAAVRAAGCAGFCCYSAKFVNFHETLCAKAF